MSDEAERSIRRGIAEINARIVAGQATVWSDAVLRDSDRSNLAPDQVDVVTLAFATATAGTAAMMIIPVAGRGVFTRAEEIWLNGVAGIPGPAPNERLGMVDTMIYADDVTEVNGSDYSGAQLLFDIVGGAAIDVDCLSLEGSRHRARTHLAEMEFARFYVHNAFLDEGLPGPVVDVLGRGSRVFLNGANGVILGRGTRDSTARRSWSLAADMHDMQAGLMADANGLRNTIAVAVPVLDGAVLDGLVDWASARPSDLVSDAAAETLRRAIQDGGFTLTDTDYAI